MIVHVKISYWSEHTHIEGVLDSRHTSQPSLRFADTEFISGMKMSKDLGLFQVVWPLTKTVSINQSSRVTDLEYLQWLVAQGVNQIVLPTCRMCPREKYLFAKKSHLRIQSRRLNPQQQTAQMVR